MQAKVGLEVAGAAEALVAHPALVGPLPCVHQVVLLQVGQLGESLLTQGTLKWTLPTVYTQVDLEIGQLPKVLATLIALVQDFTIPFLQRVGQGYDAGLGAWLLCRSCHNSLSWGEG